MASIKRILVVIIGLFLFDAFLWGTLASSAKREKETVLYFFSVGQGDSSMIALPGSVQILIDGGPPNRKLLTELAKSLGLADKYIDLVIMTHPQLDHFGGFIDVFNKYEVGAFIASGRAGDTDAYSELRKKIQTEKIPYITLGAGGAIRVGEAYGEFLGPTKDEMKSEELNDTSLVLRLKSGGLTALFTGDIGKPGEDRLVREGGIASLVLKVPHHGSRFSSNKKFLEAVNPRIAVIEVGKNSYGHPTVGAIKRLKESGAKIFRTDQNGTIRVIRRGQKIDVITGQKRVDKK